MKPSILVHLAWTLALAFPQSARSQTVSSPEDTTLFKTASVLSLRIPTPEDRVSGNAHTLSTETLQNGRSPDLEDALNALPGVRMETRGFGGSRRLQIRSSGIRAPFAVRNVHMLMDGFVLTNASGISPLDLWNPQWMSQLEVLKGPVGAIYGSGYGGVLLGTSLNSFQDKKTSSISGYSRLATNGSDTLSLNGISSESGFQWQRISNSTEWTLRGLWNEVPGGRLHESNGRKQLEFHRRKKMEDGRLTHLWTGWMDASWDLPGSLNASDANLAPASSPGAEFDAHVDRMRTWIGYSSEKRQNEKQSGLWIYAQHTEKQNPFGTSPYFNGLKDESEQFASARWWEAKTALLSNGSKFTWDKTAILRAEDLSLRESDLNPVDDAYRYQFQSITINVWGSSGIRLENNKWQLDAQMAFEWMRRNTDGDGTVDDGSKLAIAENYKHLAALPFIGFSFEFTEQSRLFLQYGKATSHPTTFELVDPDLYTTLNLLPERANAIELGWKGNTDFKQASVTYSLQAYQQEVGNAIASVQRESDGFYIDNIQGLQMVGLEGYCNAMVTLKNSHWVVLQGQGSMNRHSFNSVTEALPGTPLHASSFQAAYHTERWAAGTMHYWNDRMPLHNSKDDWSQAHQRLDAWISLKSAACTWQFGVRNILDSKYSSWFQTNGFGGRYFNPAPARLVWLSWRWQIS
jgi:iron complex outermembrane recepter protein